ncbi:MAG: PIN domain-containing protein [Eubacteriaceae bacterium]|nr:PIN domain-containing protein [Eubacteriaceae bacterium]
MKKLIRLISFAAGFLAGFQLFAFISGTGTPSFKFFGIEFSGLAAHYTLRTVSGFIFGLIFLIFIPMMVNSFASVTDKWVKNLRRIPLQQIIANIIAIIVSLVLAAMITSPLYKLNLQTWLATLVTVVVYSGVVYIGLLLCNQKFADIDALLRTLLNFARDKRDEGNTTLPRARQRSRQQANIPKILDTSVIIDGRIFDILRTGFLEGPVVIPTFVLEELQFIADSSDSLKRNRGRRGLDILNKIQKELISIEIIISEKNYPEISEVDTKLLKLTQEMKGKIVTNDYNLNKIAELQGVDVLNTNDLTNAVKSIVLPGEEMPVQIIKEGKEHNQGVAYLDDGTMIVVEGGRFLIGKNAHVVVTSVLQTSAGRMVFAKPVAH